MEKRIQRSSCRSRQTQRRRSTARPYLRGLRWNPGACWDREDSSLDYSAGLSRVIKSFPLRRGFAERCAPECEKRSRDVIRARSIRAAAIVRNRDSRYARRRRSINYPDVTVGRAAGRGEGGRGGGRGMYVRSPCQPNADDRAALCRRVSCHSLYVPRREIARIRAGYGARYEDRGVGPRVPGETGA